MPYARHVKLEVPCTGNIPCTLDPSPSWRKEQGKPGQLNTFFGQSAIILKYNGCTFTYRNIYRIRSTSDGDFGQWGKTSVIQLYLSLYVLSFLEWGIIKMLFYGLWITRFADMPMFGIHRILVIFRWRILLGPNPKVWGL